MAKRKVPKLSDFMDSDTGETDYIGYDSALDSFYNECDEDYDRERLGDKNQFLQSEEDND